MTRREWSILRAHLFVLCLALALVVFIDAVPYYRA